jgi:hypothetical protein
MVSKCYSLKKFWDRSEFIDIVMGRLEPACACKIGPRGGHSVFKVSEWRNRLPWAVGKQEIFPCTGEVSDINATVLCTVYGKHMKSWSKEFEWQHIF